jgi:hypothetical protein
MHRRRTHGDILVIGVCVIEVLEQAVEWVARVITGNEIWVHFENLRSALWVGTGPRRSNQPKQLIGAKKVFCCACFTPIRIVDIVMLPA